MCIEFIVEGKPQGKGRPRFRRNGSAYTPEKTKIYENAVKLAFRDAGGVMLDGPVMAYITAVFEVPKRTSKKDRAEMIAGKIVPCIKPDCDNIAKIILDALNGMAYKDDNQVVWLQVQKKYGEQGHVRVCLIGRDSE